MQMEKMRMRRNFADILNSAKIDYKNEYKKVYDLLFVAKYQVENSGEQTIFEIFNDAFPNFWFANTCLSLDEFNKINGITFPEPNENILLVDLVSLLEYFMNLLCAYRGTILYGMLCFAPFNIERLNRYINNVADAIEYEFSNQDGLYILVEKNAVVTAVAESALIPDDLSHKIIAYNHHDMQGDIESKKATLLRLYLLLEENKSKLHQVNSNLENDLFYIFNNFNIRHNNCDSKSKNYKPGIASMDKQELENWYDETYQMCLLAFMELEQADRKPKFDAIKDEIEKK